MPKCPLKKSETLRHQTHSAEMSWVRSVLGPKCPYTRLFPWIFTENNDLTLWLTRITALLSLLTSSNLARSLCHNMHYIKQMSKWFLWQRISRNFPYEKTRHRIAKYTGEWGDVTDVHTPAQLHTRAALSWLSLTSSFLLEYSNKQQTD